MAQDIVKLRVKLNATQEFEAEGPQEFVLAQRDYFMARQQTNTQTSTPLSQNSPTPPTQPPDVASQEKPLFEGARMWEQLFKCEGELIILRRKAKLSAEEAALLLLAGARALLNKAEYSALLLSRALQESGFHTRRLDRLLAPMENAGYIQTEGMKRGRVYRLTQAGFTRAFVLANKKVSDFL